MSLADVTKALETLQLDLLKSTWNAPLQARWSEVSSSTRPSENLQLLALPEADPHLLPISVSTATGSKPTAITIEQTHKTSLNTLATDPKTNYKIRLLQFARAAIFALNYQEPPLDPAQLEAASSDIHDLTLSILIQFDDIQLKENPQPEDKKDYIEHLAKLNIHAFSELVTKLREATHNKNYKKAEKELIIAEQVLTWHEGRIAQTNISYLKLGTKIYEIKRTETPMAGSLTEGQKLEYLNIHSATPPLWFNEAIKSSNSYEHPPNSGQRYSFLQLYLKKTVPKNMDDDWSLIEHSIPTSLRRIPGLANFTRNTITISDVTDPNNPIVLNTSFNYRSATPPPTNLKYNLKSSLKNKSERARLTRQNIEQYVIARLADENLPEENGKKIIHINSLLNDLLGENLLRTQDNNTRMLGEIRRAIKAIQEKRSDIKLVLSSVPINNFRYSSITRNTHKRADDQKYIDYCETLLNNPTTFEARKKLLQAAKTALENLKDRTDYFGDMNLIRAGLYEIIAPGSLSGCKSGKDREVYKQDYAASLLTYYSVNNKFPNFNLPRRVVSIPLNILGYVGITALAVCGIFSLMVPGFLPFAAILGLAAGGGALILTTATYHLFNRPNLMARSHFLKIVRHIRLSGFGVLSASLNAPGTYGQKDEDISPSDLINLRQAQFPFRGKAQLITRAVDAALYILATGVLATAAYFLLTHFLVLSAPLTLALPVLFAATMVTPVVANLVGHLIQYYSSPIDNSERETIKQFKEAHAIEKILSKANKIKSPKHLAHSNQVVPDPQLSKLSITVRVPRSSSTSVSTPSHSPNEGTPESRVNKSPSNR